MVRITLIFTEKTFKNVFVREIRPIRVLKKQSRFTSSK